MRTASVIALAAMLGATAAQADEAQVVKVSLKEWELGFKEVTVEGEKARFEITNDGTIQHAFELEGEIGGKDFEIATALLDPGQSVTLVAELPAGSYEVYCPVDGHEDRGMKGEVTFTGEE